MPPEGTRSTSYCRAGRPPRLAQLRKERTLDVLTIICVALGAFLLAGFAQSLTGFGSSLVAAPLIAFVLGAGPTVVAVTLASLTLTGWAGVREREHVEVKLAWRISLAGLIGLPFGLLLLSRADDAVLKVLMAAVVLAALVLMMVRLRLPRGAATTWLAGIFSGVLLTSTGMNGPPLVLAMDAEQLEPRRFRGTLQVVLCGQDAAAAIGFIIVGSISHDALLAAAVGVVASPVGWRVGDLVFDKIPPALFRRVLVAGLAASAVLLALSHLA